MIQSFFLIRLSVFQGINQGISGCYPSACMQSMQIPAQLRFYDSIKTPTGGNRWEL